MRRARWLGIGFVALGMPVAAAAQNAQCAGLADLAGARRTCDAAVDFARAYFPLAGLAMSGGNQVLGHGSASGRPGAVVITVRTNLFRLSVPDLAAVSSAGTVPERSSALAPAPLVEARVGLFGGLRRGFLAIDALGAAQLVPNEKFAAGIRSDSDAVRIGPVSLGIGLGARIGIVAESRRRPGLAVDVMRRSIPRTGYGDVASGDEIQADATVVAWDIRGTVGKRLGLLSLAAGAGWSHFSGTASAAYRVGPLPGEQGAFTVDLAASRWIGYVDAGLNLPVVALVAEVGYQGGKDQQLGTTFQGYDDTAGTTFFSGGLQFGF